MSRGLAEDGKMMSYYTMPYAGDVLLASLILSPDETTERMRAEYQSLT